MALGSFAIAGGDLGLVEHALGQIHVGTTVASLSQRSQLAQDGSGVIVLSERDERHRQLKLVVRVVIPKAEQALVASPGAGEILVVERARRLLLIAADQTGI